MPVKYYKIIYCLMQLFMISTSEEVPDENVYEFYPCSQSDNIIETFKRSNPPNYNLTIFLHKSLVSSDNVKLRVKYDDLTKTTMHFKYKVYFDDSRSLEATIGKLSNLTLTIAPLYGKKLPNILSVKVDSNELCNGFINKDIWDNYFDMNEETTTLTVTTLKDVKAIKNLNMCGKTFVSDEGYIVKGIDSTPGKWPWHTALYRLQDDKQKYICGGSLISKTIILTAGHCVLESGSIVLAERLIAILGKYNFIGNNVHLQEKKVYKIILHPNFSKANLQNDLAILKLSSEVLFNDYVQPICLLFKELQYVKIVKSVGTLGYAVGWGATERYNHSDHLIESQLPIVTKFDCMKSHAVFLNRLLSDGSFCAGSRNGTNVCNGDSGGGLYFKLKINQEDVWYLGGIVSLGVPQQNNNKCDPTQYALFTDVFYYKEFIDEHL